MNSPTESPPAAETHSTLAWCGWQLQVPDAWHPLKIQGDAAKGSVMIGDGERPQVMVQWRKTESTGFDADRWMEQRLKKQGTAPDTDAPHPPGVDAATWSRGIEVRENESKSLWYGYSESSGLLLELVTAQLTAEQDAHEILDDVLPMMKVTGQDEPCAWSVFNVSFISPPGFALAHRHLYSGDIALGLTRGRHERLLLRQVYPAGVALERRSLNTWLESPPFTERRKAPKAEAKPWEQRGRNGILRQGWRRLPVPLGWCNRRYGTAIAAVDSALDRILIAEHQTRRDNDAACTAECIQNMNVG